MDKLHPDQVWDSTRVCFFVGLKVEGEHKVHGPIYSDATGRKFVVVPRG